MYECTPDGQRPGTTNTRREGEGGKQCTFRTRGKINLIVSEIEFTRAVRLSRSSSGTTKSLTMLSRCPNRGGDTRVPSHWHTVQANVHNTTLSSS